jgi:hypothetical protein
MDKHSVVESRATTQDIMAYEPATSTAASRAIEVEAPTRIRTPGRRSGAKRVDNAVYAHIRAVRALGKTEVNTAEISKALGIPLREVEEAASRLTAKGVKVV